MQFYEGSCRMLEDRRVGGIPSVVTAHNGVEISVTHQLSGERETPRVTTSQPAARSQLSLVFLVPWVTELFKQNIKRILLWNIHIHGSLWQWFKSQTQDPVLKSSVNSAFNNVLGCSVWSFIKEVIFILNFWTGNLIAEILNLIFLPLGIRNSRILRKIRLIFWDKPFLNRILFNRKIF